VYCVSGGGGGAFFFPQKYGTLYRTRAHIESTCNLKLSEQFGPCQEFRYDVLDAGGRQNLNQLIRGYTSVMHNLKFTGFLNQGILSQ